MIKRCIEKLVLTMTYIYVIDPVVVLLHLNSLLALLVFGILYPWGSKIVLIGLIPCLLIAITLFILEDKINKRIFFPIYRDILKRIKNNEINIHGAITNEDLLKILISLYSVEANIRFREYMNEDLPKDSDPKNKMGNETY